MADSSETNEAPPVTAPVSMVRYIKTHIDALDDALGGGIPEKNLVMVTGEPGTFKTSLVLNIFYNQAVHNKKTCWYISLEEDANSLQETLRELGFDLGKVKITVLNDLSQLFPRINSLKGQKRDQGEIVIVDLSTTRAAENEELLNGGFSGDDEPREFRSGEKYIRYIQNLVSSLNSSGADLCDLLAIDSFAAITALGNLEKHDNPRQAVFNLFENVKKSKVTVFLISEKNDSEAYEAATYESDGEIQLGFDYRKLKNLRFFVIKKMRHTNSSTKIFNFEFEQGGKWNIYGALSKPKPQPVQELSAEEQLLEEAEE